MKKLKSAILGATGMAGQQFIEALEDHPFIEITDLYASKRSAGKKYRERVPVWHGLNPPSDEIWEKTIKLVDDVDYNSVDIIFSALPGSIAREHEAKCAKFKPVISTTSAFRYDDDVPILIPETNIEHTKLIEVQRKNHDWKGFVVPGPNCTTVGLVMSLKPIYESFGLDWVIMVSMQAISGAGYPGVSAYDITANVIPHIRNEEPKVKKETLKILGKYQNGKIINADFKLDCKCNRVTSVDGHLESVFVKTKKNCSVEDIKKVLKNCPGLDKNKYPTAIETPVVVNEDIYRPQPRIDAEKYGGMAAIVGGIEKTVFDGFKYSVLSHNTKRGAAKGEILVAEYLYKEGFF
ncbi:MAG: aspartate-semialdehyde dehydrogenase [Candidatus Lokiarchaeota archaeon]|nr:aspartate-semialdehyde dehydrogenase [Candidatus Lokiarchaeota archaeon]